MPVSPIRTLLAFPSASVCLYFDYASLTCVDPESASTVCFEALFRKTKTEAEAKEASKEGRRRNKRDTITVETTIILRFPFASSSPLQFSLLF